jgi:cupin 2 domain-containing protein
MSAFARGRLRRSSDAPEEGELSEQIGQVGGVTVVQILSGPLETPVKYDQDHDEWVVLLSGSALLEVGTERLRLEGGDWLFLPAHLPHRLIHTSHGANWLALNCEPEG